MNENALIDLGMHMSSTGRRQVYQLSYQDTPKGVELIARYGPDRWDFYSALVVDGCLLAVDPLPGIACAYRRYIRTVTSVK